jgi:uncharacterized protein YxeA
MAKKQSKTTLKTLMSQNKKLIIFIIIAVASLAMFLLLRKDTADIPTYVEKYETFLNNELTTIDKKLTTLEKTKYKQCSYQKTGKTQISLFCEIRYNLLVKNATDIDTYLQAPFNSDTGLGCRKDKSFSDPSKVNLVVQCYEKTNKPYFPLTNTKDRL